MTYNEDDFIQLSALQHMLFCERQCALIHIEQVWAENLFTAEGRIMHERVDNSKSESRKNVRTEFSVPLRSFRLGLVGKADVVEFSRKENKWYPFPVEYKRGKPKVDNCDKIQLCAQAICLEEMLHLELSDGAIFYGRTRRREAVLFDKVLRDETENTARKVHALIKSEKTPHPEYSQRCRTCSLFQQCMPVPCSKKQKASRYLNNVLKDLDDNPDQHAIRGVTSL